MNGICYIVGAGELFENDIIDKKPEDLLIAADGGYDKIKELSPDISIGDSDSGKTIPQGCEIIKLPCEKDDTDMLAAIKEGIKRGYRDFRIYGGTGGRISHTIANIQCLLYLALNNMNGMLFDKTSCMTVIKNRRVDFPEEYRGYFSLFSLCEKSEKVTIGGMKYKLQNADVYSSFPIGISNEFRGEKSFVSVENGELLLIYGRENIEKNYKA